MHNIKLLFLCLWIFVGGVNLLLFDGKNDTRLSRNIQPELYALNFIINDERFIFTGNVSITFRVVNATDIIQLHAKDISVNWLSAVLKNVSHAFEVAELKLSTSDIVELKYHQEMTVGVYQLQLSFFGDINQNLKGLYSITNEDQKAGKRPTIATNLYPNLARNVFPCFDEPELRAKFQLNIYHDRSFMVVSNMPISEKTGPHAEYNGLMLSQFPESIEMPTYSFGFIIGQNTMKINENQRVQIYAPTTKNISDALWYYRQSTKILEKIQNYLGSPFQLPKLHIVAISNDDEMGFNMWGVIRVPEKFMYFDNNRATDVIIDDHQDGITYIANQIARNWFMNAVTPEDSWLNDGFAKYLEYLISAQIVPDWRLLEQFLVNENHVALSADAVLTATPLATTIGSTDPKAGGFIRMLEGIFGSEVLKKIIRVYVAKKSGSIATADDLIEIAHAEVTIAGIKLPTSVKEIIESWIKNPGYPLVKITRHYGDASKVTIIQKRFVSDVYKTGNEAWPLQYIPVTLSTRDSLDFNETNPALWLLPTMPDLPSVSYTIHPPVAPSSWIIVNNQQSGFYRVNYDRTNWNLLINGLARKNFDNISVLNRAQLIDDAFNLADSGERSFDLAFSILNYLREETDFVPWKTATRSLNQLERMLGGKEQHKLLELFIQNITSNVFNLIAVTDNETNHVLRLLRRDVAKLACKAGLPACIAEVEGIFQQVLQDTSKIMPEMLETIFCTAIKFSPNPKKLAQSIVEYVLNTYKTKGAPSKEEMYRVVASLGCLQDESSLIRYLELTTMVLPPSFRVDLSKNDRQIFFTSILRGGYVATKSCLEYLKRSFSTIELRFASMPKLLGDFGPYIVSEELKTLFSAMLKQHETKLTEPMRIAAARSLAVADRNLKWGELNHASIVKWLDENVPVRSVPASGTLHFINVLTFFTSLSLLFLIQNITA